MKTKPIVDWDIDEATYIGSEEDGVYFQVAEKTRGKNKGWYVTALIDCNSSPWTDCFLKDDGPYQTEEEAREAGRNYAHEWCIDNGVDWNTLNTFSELMFNIKYNFGQSEFDLLIAKPDFAKFMTLEESELTEELASELQEKIDFLQWSWKPASMKDQAK